MSTPVFLRRTVRLAVLLPLFVGLLASACGEESPTGASPSGPLPVLPAPEVPRTVSVGNSGAQVVVVAELNRARLIAQDGATVLGFFDRDAWREDGDGCRTDADTLWPGCSIRYNACASGDELHWTMQAESGGCGLSSPGFVEGTTTAGGSGSFVRRNAPGADARVSVAWDTGREGVVHWRFYSGEAIPGTELGFLDDASPGSDRKILTWSQDLRRWSLETTARGEVGDMEVFGREDSSAEWDLLHRVSWAPGHGEWIDYTLDDGPGATNW